MTSPFSKMFRYSVTAFALMLQTPNPAKGMNTTEKEDAYHRPSPHSTSPSSSASSENPKNRENDKEEEIALPIFLADIVATSDKVNAWINECGESQKGPLKERKRTRLLNSSEVRAADAMPSRDSVITSLSRHEWVQIGRFILPLYAPARKPERKQFSHEEWVEEALSSLQLSEKVGWAHGARRPHIIKEVGKRVHVLIKVHNLLSTKFNEYIPFANEKALLIKELTEERVVF